MDVGGEAIGQVPGHGKPAACIEQVADGIANLRQFQTFDGAAGIAFEHAVIGKDIGVLLALYQGRWRRDDDGGVGPALAGERLIGCVGNLFDLERTVQIENRRIGIIERRKGDLCCGGKLVVGRSELGVDGVAGDMDRWSLLCDERRGEDQQ